MINSRLALCFIAKCCACIPSIRDVTVGYEVTTVLFFMFCSVRHRCLPVQYKIKSQSKKCASCKLTEEAKAINTIGLGQTGMGFCLYFVARKCSEVLRQYITQWLLRVVQWKKTTVDWKVFKMSLKRDVSYVSILQRNESFSWQMGWRKYVGIY